MRNYEYLLRKNCLPRRARVGFTSPVEGDGDRGRGTDPARHFPDQAGEFTTPPAILLDLDGGGQRLLYERG